MPNILVTGGAGYVGSHTVNLLLKRGFDVIVADNLSRGYRHNTDPQRLHVIDLTDTGALRRLLGEQRFDAVVHFAAFIAVGESVEMPEVYFANNTGGTISLLQSMVEAGISRFVFSSTAAVYGIPDQIPVREDAPFAPVSPYGESKAMAEKVLGWLDRSRGFRSIALRYFNASGADTESGLGEEHDPETHLIPLLLRAAVTGRPITIFGDDYETPDGTCIRDYIHVNDLAEAHVVALNSLLAGGRSDAFNCGTGSGHSVREVMSMVEMVTGRKVPYEIGPRREGDPPVLVADSQKLQRTLGWRPTRDLRDIVSSAWEFEKRRKAQRAIPQ